MPRGPDVMQLLVAQGRVTVAGLDALCAWAHGDADQGRVVRDKEHEADDAQRRVLVAVRQSFVLPIAPEDAFELSERLDRVMNGAKNLVREAQVLGVVPDPPVAGITDLVAAAMHELVDVLPDLPRQGQRAISAADSAMSKVHDVDRIYRRAMSGLLEEHDLRQVVGRRELYRRATLLADLAEGVATRVWYAVVKLA